MTTREGGVGVEEGEYAKLSEEQKNLIILLVKQKLAEVKEEEAEEVEKRTAKIMKLVEKLSVEEMLELGKEIVAGQEVGNAKHLDKLPLKVWEKILDELDENDLFPLAMSCRYFRQKQKELVARTRQSGPESAKPHLTLKTNLGRTLLALCDGMPASPEYIRFCGVEPPWYVEEGTEVGMKKAAFTVLIAANRGYLPLLKELYKANYKSGMIPPLVRNAGESSSSQSSPLLCFCF